MKKNKFYFNKLAFLSLVLCLFIGTFAVNGFASEHTDNIEDNEPQVQQQEEVDKEEVIEEEEESIEEDIMNNTAPKDKILFSDIDRDTYQDVEVYLRIDDKDIAESQLIPSGYAMESANSLKLSERTEVREARVLFEDGKTSKVTRIMNTNGVTYYALSSSGNTGIRLKENQKIIYICSTFYEVFTKIRVDDTFVENATESSIDVAERAYVGEDLEVTYRSGKYHTLTNHYQSYQIGNEIVEIKDVENGSNTYVYTIPAEEIVHTTVDKDKIVISMSVQSDESYQIGVNLSNGNWCHTCSKPHDHDNGLQGEGNDQKLLVTPGKTITLLVYTQSSTGGGSWGLNDLSINGEYVADVPEDAVGSQSVTTLSNGSVVTVTLIGRNIAHNTTEKCVDYERWIPSGKKRYVYEVEITDVQENMTLNGNVKEGSRREIIFRDLEGIGKLQAGEEGSWAEANIFKPGRIGRHYGYWLQGKSGINVYKAYYDEYGLGKTYSYNIYAFSVKEGYNPNSLSGEIYYNGVKQTEIPWLEGSVPEIDDEGNSDDDGEESVSIGRVSTVQELTNKLDSNRRHFKPHQRGTWPFQYYTPEKRFDDVCKEMGLDYAFGLDQNKAKNQEMFLRANPYLYNFEFDLDGGNYAGANLEGQYNFVDDSCTGTFTETGNGKDNIQYYTWVYGDVISNLPTVAPKRNGYSFEGWQLVKIDDEGNEYTVTGEKYQKGAGFEITQETVENKITMGDEKKDVGHVFKFKAVWHDISNDKDNTPYTTTIYRENPTGQHLAKNGKRYTSFYYESEYGPVGSDVVSLLFENPGKGYHFNTEDSKITIDGLQDNDDIVNPDWEKHNSIVFYYDIDWELTKDAYIAGSTESENGAVDEAIVLSKEELLAYEITLRNPTSYDLTFGENFKIEDTVPKGLKIYETSSGATSDNQQVTYQGSTTILAEDSLKITIATLVENQGLYYNEATAHIYPDQKTTSNKTYHKWLGKKSKVTTTFHIEGEDADQESGLINCVTFVTKDNQPDNDFYLMSVNKGKPTIEKYGAPTIHDGLAHGGEIIKDEMYDFNYVAWMPKGIEGYNLTAYYTTNGTKTPIDVRGAGNDYQFELSQEAVGAEAQVDIIYTKYEIPLTGISEGLKIQKLAIGALGTLFIAGILLGIRRKISRD